MPNYCSEEKARRGTPLLLGRARYSDTPELGLRFRGCHVQDRFLVGHNVFSVDVDAVPEGTAVFAHQPMLRCPLRAIDVLVEGIGDFDARQQTSPPLQRLQTSGGDLL